MRKINIMEFRSTHTTGGGPDKTILVSAKQHDKERFNIIVVYLKGPEDVEFKITGMAQEMGLNFIEVEEHGKLSIRDVNYMSSLINKHNIDILHAHDCKTDVFGCFLKRKNKELVLLTTAHGWIDEGIKQRFYNWLDFKAIKRFDKVIAVCVANKDKLIKQGVSPDKIIMMYNGIDMDEWKGYETTEGLREELLLPKNIPIIGAIGRLSYEKGLDTLLKCAAAVVKIIPEARFVIAGRGPEEENLKSYTRQLGIEQNVIFLGHRSDAKNIYNSIDVFVNPSLTEGIANTILEAQAMEKPVITTDVGGSGEIITHNANGFLVQPGDVADITEKIMYLLKNKDVAEKIGRQGRKVMYEKFSFKDRLRKIEDLYVELTKRR